jgi:hypothetical protein
MDKAGTRFAGDVANIKYISRLDGALAHVQARCVFITTSVDVDWQHASRLRDGHTAPQALIAPGFNI